MEEIEEKQKIAIFFDAENVSSAKVGQVISFLRGKGDVLFQRAYADWSMQNTSSWKDQLSKIPITAIQQFHEKSEDGKNDSKESVDKAIMMDCIEMAIKHEEITTFALVTSDNGFFTLALRLRELGKKVIGMGEKEKSHDRWVNSCNEFSYLENLEEIDDKIIVDSKNAENQKDIEEFQNFSLEKFLESAYDTTPIYKNTNSVLLSQLWSSVLAIKPDFNVKDYNKKSPLEFIKSFEDRFKVFDDGKIPKTFFVEKRENPTLESSMQKTGKIKRWMSYFGIIVANDNTGDYFFHKTDISPDFKNEKIKKDIEVQFSVMKLPNPSANETSEKNGKATDIKIK